MECPTCHVPLVAVDNEAPDPQAELVPVLETTEAGLVPLARAALEQEGIQFAVQNRGFADQIMGRRSSMTVGEMDTPLVIVVRAEDSPRATAVLDALTTADSTSVVSTPAPAPAPSPSAPASAAQPVLLQDADSGRTIGSISDAQFASLAQHLVRESDEDDDYYIDEATLTMLSDRGVDAGVLALLKTALGGRPDLTVRWKRV
jgi:hypothetical protein